MRILTGCALCCILLTRICSAVVIHETTSYPTPLKRISGSVIGYGNLNPGVKVEVFDKPELWADDSLSFNEKRKRQKLIATTRTDAKGRFDIRRVPKGTYEVQFSTGYDGGWNILSVFAKIDPAGSRERLCVKVALEGALEESSVAGCH